MKNGLRATHVWRFCIAFAVVAVILLPTALPAQQWITVSPEEAATHLIKKVEPVYPAFAKAAGIQGTIHVSLSIGPTGRTQILQTGGPPSLEDAARKTVLQYVYKPFEKNGQPVAVETTVDVVFELPGGAPTPPPPPAFSAMTIIPFYQAVFPLAYSAGYKCMDCVTTVSPTLRKWLAKDVKKQVLDMEDGSESSPDFLSVETALNDVKADWPEEIELVELPVAKHDMHLYIFRPHLPQLCGASGNCPGELVEEDARGIRSMMEMDADGYSIYTRPGSPFPDIFTHWHMSAIEADVAGYSNVEGMWGQVYCGEMTWSEDQGKETDDVHVCR